MYTCQAERGRILNASPYYSDDRAKHYGVPIDQIKPYPILDEPLNHDHYGPPDAHGWRTVTKVDGRESECPECCEPDDAEGGERE